MKNINLFILLFLVIITTACIDTTIKNIQTYQIPDTLIVDADTATIIPDFQKKIGDTKLVCYIVDSCSRSYEYPAQITMSELGNPILTRNDLLDIQLAKIENDSFSISFPEMVGTGNVSCAFPITDSTECYFRAYIEPGKTNKIWVDITKSLEYSYDVYSDNAYNALNYAINKFSPYYKSVLQIPENKFTDLSKTEYIEMVMHQHDSIVDCINKDSIANTTRTHFIEFSKYNAYEIIKAYNKFKQEYSKREILKHEYISTEELQKTFNNLNFNPQFLFYLIDGDLLNDNSIDLKDYSKDVYSISQLARLCDKFDENLWENAPEDAADFINDDFYIAAYKHYRMQGIEAHKRAEGVYVEATPNVADNDLFTAMMQRYKGKPIVVYFWGPIDLLSLYDIRINKSKKSADSTYVYITSNNKSSKTEWNKTINKVSGYHYLISDASFDYILRQFGNVHGMIPFKLYVDEEGKIFTYEDRTPLDIESKEENKLPVYIEEAPNVPNDSLISAIIERHIGTPTVIDLWGVYCMPCMAEISLKENTKTEDINYVYLTCPRWSPRDKWETTIKDISGYHYYVSNEVFNFILDNYQATGIPFKLFISKNGKLERTVVGAEY